MRSACVFLVPMLGVLMVTLFTGVAGAERARVAGQVIAVAGPVTVSRTDMPRHALKFRDELFWRDVVEAHKDGIARVLLLAKATVTVRELSRLELRQEKRVEGVRYIAELISGKVRASVARMLMRQGEQVEVWTWNAVASVRGTDFIVEAVERPAQAGAFGLLGAREVSRGVEDRASRSRETVVVTISGVVDVSNRLAGTGRVERIAAYEATRVSGKQDPVRFQLSADEMKRYLNGLTPPRPQEARSGDKAEAVGTKVEGAALVASRQSGRALERASAGDRGPQEPGKGEKQSSLAGGQSSQRGGQGNGNGLALGQVNGQGNGLALGLGNSQSNGVGLGVDHANLANALSQGNSGTTPGQTKSKKK